MTRTAILQEIARLNDLHAASTTASGAPRAPITWPTVPDMIDFADLPPAPPGTTSDTLIAETITIARWLADLADAWTGIETRRLSREHLRGTDPDPRPFPTTTRATN